MRLHFGLLFAGLLLAACASEDPRYRDTSTLEKPPTLVIEKQEPAGEAPENAGADKRPEDAASAADEDRNEAKAKIKKGLGDQAVSISEVPPWVLTLRQPFDTAWNSLKRAMIQSGIEVTDLEHDKGKFYVSYDADSYVSKHGSMIEKTLGLFSDDYEKRPYVLTVSPEESVTKVTVAPGKDAEYRKRTDRDDEEIADQADTAEDKPAGGGAEKLLRSLYFTLKDDLRED
ncbi:outer membrane protein assembly factor BamC [Methylomicrobium agile]|uniref:outer membrane protein assembly factor BamC n=1 Tax=Methylomicrobium agile TaxID=39774 RepID=UPI0004DF4191|nr:outer membrane protein assembly factor BamC [Methylomicrobium agile]